MTKCVPLQYLMPSYAPVYFDIHGVLPHKIVAHRAGKLPQIKIHLLCTLEYFLSLTWSEINFYQVLVKISKLVPHNLKYLASIFCFNVPHSAISNDCDPVSMTIFQ